MNDSFYNRHPLTVLFLCCSFLFAAISMFFMSYRDLNAENQFRYEAERGKLEATLDSGEYRYVLDGEELESVDLDVIFDPEDPWNYEVMYDDKGKTVIIKTKEQGFLDWLFS